MTETSYYWDGLVTGDAVLAPYSSDLWHRLWQVMFSRADNEGVINNADNELAVSGVAVSVSVATGKAVVDGTLYENSAAVSVAIPTPVTDPRIDRIVVQKDWSTKTIRIARVAGTENASPTAPALTQTDASIWEIPLAQALVTIAGVITVTDERENARTRLALAGAGVSEIETIIGTGIESTFDFTNIPDTFRHLEIHGNVLTGAVGGGSADIIFNGDTTSANYNRQVFARSGGIVTAGPGVGQEPRIDTISTGALSPQYNTQLFARIPNYKDTTFYKTMLQKEIVNHDDTGTTTNNISLEDAIWLDTSAINQISIVAAGGGVFQPGTVISLYGID